VAGAELFAEPWLLTLGSVIGGRSALPRFRHDDLESRFKETQCEFWQLSRLFARQLFLL